MDQLLEFAFMLALKTRQGPQLLRALLADISCRVTDKDLPILASDMFSNHMVTRHTPFPAVPGDEGLRELRIVIRDRVA